MPHNASLAADVNKDEHAEIQLLLATINAAHNVFQNRHNWLSPLTTNGERADFIAAACVWWNNVVCPAMDSIGALWNEDKQRFELPT